MKITALILTVLLIISSCSVQPDKPALSPLTEEFTVLKAEALYRDGMVHHLYPDIDISEIKSLPVYKITDNETNDLHTESARTCRKV